LWIITPVHAYEFPPYEGVTLKINGKISENYSNNITYTQDNDKRIEQWTTLLILGLDVGYQGKKRSLRLGGTTRQPVRFDKSDIRNSSEIYTFDIDNEFSQFDRVRMRDIYTHTRVPESFNQVDFREECVKLYRDYGLEVARDDPRCSEFEREFGVRQGAFDTYRNDFHVNYSKNLSDQIGVSVLYGNSRFDSTEEFSNDSVRNNINGNISYSFSYASTFYLSYSFSETSYDSGDNISTNSFRAGIRQYITKRLYFSGGIGMTFSPSAENTSFDAIVTGDVDENTVATIDFSNDIRAAVNTDDEFRNWRITGLLSRLLMEDMNVFLSAFYGEGKFISAGVTDTLLGASGSLSYFFWQHKRGARIDGTLGYSYSKTTSNEKTREYDRNSVNANLSMKF